MAISLLGLAGPAVLRGAAIQAGDVTSILGPAFFVDDAANDTGVAAALNEPSVQGYNRFFNRLLTKNQGPTRITITGFGFAANHNAVENDATSLTVTLIYLGPDEAHDTADDVVIGSATGAYTYSGEGEHVFAFATPITADLNITGTRFRILLAPSNATGSGSVRLKSGTLAYETFTGSRLSVAGFASSPINPQRWNLAKFQSVTTSSASGQFSGSYVTDGVTGNDNRWQSTGNGPHWAEVNFPFPVEAGSAQIFTGVDDSSAAGNFSIQYLDGGTWVTIPGASVTGNTDVERNMVFTSPVSASSFRIYSTDGTIRVREFALYAPNGPSGYPLGTDLTLNLAYQRPAVASANSAGNFALNAVDGRAETFMWSTTTAGINTLDIDLRVITKIGSAHVYSGSAGVSPLADFVLKYWDGSAWQIIPGGVVTENTSASRAISFTPVTTSQVRLEFTNPGTTSIRELQIFPANAGNAGYALGTNIIPSGAFAKYEDYNDAFHLITNPASGRRMSVPANGQPALDSTSLTFGQSQYQILLNLANGTYRLRNRASGNCLSGAQLSKAPGLPLTDVPYTALPHQDWILDPLGGGVFRLINQWSGLAVDTQGGSTAQGTTLVQNTANASATQRWQISLYALHPKKRHWRDHLRDGVQPGLGLQLGKAELESRPDGYELPSDAMGQLQLGHWQCPGAALAELPVVAR